jgi:hypothetical protein
MNFTAFQQELLYNPPRFKDSDYIFLFASLLLSAFGILLNCLLIYSLKSSKWTNSQIVTLNIAIADIINLSSKFFFHAVEVYFGAVSPPGWADLKCQLQGFFHQFGASCSVTFMLFICIDPLRLLLAPYLGTYGQLPRKWLYAFITLNWICTGLLLSLAPFLPFPGLVAKYEYHSSAAYSSYCWRCREPLIAILTILDALFLLGSPLIMVSVFGLLLYLNRTAKQQTQMKIAKKGLAFAISHIVMWTYCVTAILYEFAQRKYLPVWADKTQYILSVLSCYGNPIVVFYLNKHLRTPIIKMVEDPILKIGGENQNLPPIPVRKGSLKKAGL